MNYKIISIYYINIMENCSDVESCLNSIRELLKSVYNYEETDFFINLTGPIRNNFLNVIGDDTETIIKQDQKTILNILSQTEEGELERTDFNNCLENVKKILPETEEIWSVGGSSGQRMFSKTGNGTNEITIGAVEIGNSTDEDVEKQAKKILTSNNVVLYNSIGYQYDNVEVNVEDKDIKLISGDIKLISGSTFVSKGKDSKEKEKEKDCCKLLKKILELLKKDDYKQKKVYLVKRGGKTVIDGSHLKQKHLDLGNKNGIEISSGQIKKIDTEGNISYLHKKGKGDDSKFDNFNTKLTNILENLKSNGNVIGETVQLGGKRRRRQSRRNIKGKRSTKKARRQIRKQRNNRRSNKQKRSSRTRKSRR